MKLRDAAQKGLDDLIGGAARFTARLRAAKGGGAAMVTALAMPPILLVALGGIQLQALVTDRARTQDIADSAALWGAQQLTITPSGVAERTISYADAQLDHVKANASVTVNAVQVGKSNVKVTIDTTRPSFFFNLLPAGGFHTHVESIAEGVSQTPLCVLAIGTAANDDINVKNTSKLQGPACMVHSNRAVKADGGALVQAQTVEAATTATGPISPSASTGAPVIADPFASLSYPFPLLPACINIVDLEVSGKLAAGVHPFNLRVKDGESLELEKGDHYFCGKLELKKGATLIGDDVALVFAATADFKLADGADVNLNGRKSGKLAGFVILADRARNGDFKIDSDPISNITGTIYVPSAKLVVDGNKKSGTGSAWTVLAAEEFETRGGANLMINANYAGTDVPVPSGVGNRRGMSRITQ